LDIIRYWLNVRLEYNEKRKLNTLKSLLKKIIDNSIRARFIKAVIDRDIILENRSKQDILDQLKKFDNELYEYDTNGGDLLKMPLYSITSEKIIELSNKIDELRKEYDIVASKSPEDLLKSDLTRIS
jgi:DNA topoisomerase-2